MAECDDYVFNPMDFEYQKRHNPNNLYFETVVYKMYKNLNNSIIKPIMLETGFIYQKYAQFAPKKLN